MIARVLRRLAQRREEAKEKRRQDRSLAERKLVGKARAEAAKRGHATEHRNRIARHERLWGKLA